MPAQLTQSLLPDLRVITSRLEVQTIQHLAVQRQATSLQPRVVARNAVVVQHRAMLIRLWNGASLHNRRRGDQNQKSAHGNELLHRVQPIARSMICSGTPIIGSAPLLSQKPAYGSNIGMTAALCCSPPLVGGHRRCE